jgi:hypothetical protein
MQEADLKGLVFGGNGGKWRNVERPGYFGRRRDSMVVAFNEIYGLGKWRTAWVYVPEWQVSNLFEQVADLYKGYDEAMYSRAAWAFPFENACKTFYESSYVAWLAHHPAELEYACSFGECIDNAPTNVNSGRDYSIQESYSTHIQDIAMRNALHRLGRKFEGPPEKILVIRSKDTVGYRFGPGNVPFRTPERITQPSKCPAWANKGSVEDFWQSNKWLQALV